MSAGILVLRCAVLLVGWADGLHAIKITGICVFYINLNVVAVACCMYIHTSMQDFLRRSSRVLERALGEKEALDVLLDYAADEGDSGRGDQGQRLNEAMTLHEVH